MDYSLADLRKEKKEIQSKILEMLKGFEQKYGISVMSIEVITVDTNVIIRSVTARVDIEVDVHVE